MERRGGERWGVEGMKWEGRRGGEGRHGKRRDRSGMEERAEVWSRVERLEGQSSKGVGR